VDENEMEREFQELRNASESVDGMHLEVLTNIEDPADGITKRFNEGVKVGKNIKDDLETRLQREKRRDRQTGLQSGQFDDNKMMEAARGSVDVFSRKSKGDEKDYQAIFVTDRSGSTSQDIFGETAPGHLGGSTEYDEEEKLVYYEEIAVGAMVYALEDLGVETMVLDMYRNETYVSKMWHENLRQAKKKLFRGFHSGVTPLHGPVRNASEVAKEKENPFIVVITDGKPDNWRTYRDAIGEATCPVLGVYEIEKDEAWFHRQENITDANEITAGLQRLAKGMIL
jgi:hypothetical protein